MTLRLDTRDEQFEARFTAFLGKQRSSDDDVAGAVAEIIRRVRDDGDRALREYTRKFDRLDHETVPLAVSEEEIDRAIETTDPETLEALVFARNRIEAHHRRQLPEDGRYTDAAGVELGWQWRPLESVGIYVPGGTASYPSSVLMNAVPAQVAGVDRVVMTVPAPEGKLSSLVLAAANLAGVHEIYRVGGAQAVAALAFGTESIKPVVKIIGPGNAYVAEAKRQVFGNVGIDMIAGPSEVLIVADAANDPAWIAADLIAQAEHDRAAQSILITDDDTFADRVAEAVEGQLGRLPRRDIAAASWHDNGAIIRVDALDDALPLVNRIAAEHVELAFDNAEAFLPMIRNAGAVFVGRHTPEVIGDYVGGSNHVLPTARSARFSSGLSVLDFVKRTSILKLGVEQLAALGASAIALAEAEGLRGHSRSVSIRMNRPDPE